MSTLGQTLTSDTTWLGTRLGSHTSGEDYNGSRYGATASTASFPPLPHPAEGAIRTLGQWATGSETYVNNPANNSFYVSKIDRALVYGNYPWYGHGWRYLDMAAIYQVVDPNISGHSAQVLKDISNNNLYLHNWTGPTADRIEYAADPGNQSWRDFCQTRMTTALGSSTGMCGIMFDDVNPGLSPNTYSSSNVFTNAIDPRTNANLTAANWNKYIAEYMEQMKTAAPAAEIVSNMHWYSGNNGFTRGYNDQYIQRIIAASDWILMENGLSGMTGDNDIAWTFSFAALREFCDYCHSQNTGIAWFNYDGSMNNEYVLAQYFLFNEGYDYVGVILTSANPATYNTMYDIDLGQATSARYQVNVSGVNVWRRDFTGGTIIVNGPGMAQVTVPLGGTYTNTSGGSVTSVTLAAQRGAVLRS